MSLDGRGIVVVGASASIGRAFALGAIRAGARAVVAARRRERLEELVAEAGGGTPQVVDARDPGSCAALAEVARRALGSVDLLFYSAGYAPLRLMADTSDADWREVFATNVAGANHLIRASLPVLAPGAVVAVLSSEAVGRPRTALGAYGASKAALEEALEAWRMEQPGLRFCCLAVGATVPTEFGDHFDPELLEWALADWQARGLVQQSYMPTEELAATLVEVLGALVERPAISVERMLVRSPSRPVPSDQS